MVAVAKVGRMARGPWTVGISSCRNGDPRTGLCAHEPQRNLEVGSDLGLAGSIGFGARRAGQFELAHWAADRDPVTEPPLICSTTSKSPVSEFGIQAPFVRSTAAMTVAVPAGARSRRRRANIVRSPQPASSTSTATSPGGVEALLAERPMPDEGRVVGYEHVGQAVAFAHARVVVVKVAVLQCGEVPERLAHLEPHAAVQGRDTYDAPTMEYVQGDVLTVRASAQLGCATTAAGPIRGSCVWDRPTPPRASRLCRRRWERRRRAAPRPAGAGPASRCSGPGRGRLGPGREGRRRSVR